MSMPTGGASSDEIIDSAFATIPEVLAGEASFPGDIATTSGLTLSRLDLRYDISGSTVDQIYVITVSGDVVIQAVVTLAGSSLDDKDDVLESLETLAIRQG